MGCNLKEYRAPLDTWAARSSWRSAVGHAGTRGGNIYMGPIIVCAAVLPTLLMIGGVELNPGTVDNIVHLLFSGCGRNLNLGIQCESCGRWYYNSCGKVKFQFAVSGKWNCDRCRSERLGILEQNLRDAEIQIEELKRRSKALEEWLQLAENGKMLDIGTRWW